MRDELKVPQKALRKLKRELSSARAPRLPLISAELAIEEAAMGPTASALDGHSAPATPSSGLGTPDPQQTPHSLPSGQSSGTS